MTAAVAAVSRLLMGVGATLIGVVYVSHKNSDGGSESSEPSTTSKVISALLDKNPKSSTAPVQVAPPQPTQPLNMTVHVPNTNQSSWTWTIVIASVGVGATAVICKFLFMVLFVFLTYNFFFCDDFVLSSVIFYLT